MTPCFRYGVVLLVLVLATGCGRQPPAYPPPPQRAEVDAPDPADLGSFIRMDDPFVEEHIVRDIMPAKGEFRWAYVRPELRLKAPKGAHPRFVMEFAIPPVTFRETGPVTVTAFVNQKALASMHCPKPGRYTIEKPLPEGWLQPGAPVTVTAETDKLWVSKDDGAQLSFMLGSVGFKD